MKKLVALLLTFTMCVSLVACGGASAPASDAKKPADKAGETSSTGEATPAKREKLLFFTAFIGDFGLSDMGHRAANEIAEKYNMDVTLVEYGSYDAGLAVNCFWDALETTDYDYFFGPTWYIEELLNDAAAQYTNTQFILYDVGRDVEFKGDNIYGISFAQNEGAFVAALMQAAMSKTGKIGVISTDSPILNDFSTGWLAGAKYVKKELGKNISYLHSYLADSSMAGTYEAMNVMYGNGCDVVWPITAQFMLAGAQAAEEHGGIEKGYFVMGCDYDQWSYFKGLSDGGDSSAIGYENIITSITKNIGFTAMKVVESIKGDHSIPTGTTQWGVYQGGVGYLENENFLANVPKDVQDMLKDTIAKIGSGEIKIPSYFDFSTYDAFAKYRDNADAEFVA